METESGLVNRGNFLLVQEYLAYLLQVCLRNPKSVERYRFWLNHLLLWAMDVPLQRASSISTPFSDYVRSSNFAQENQKKIVETARAFLRWAKLHHEKQFSSLPAYRVEDLTPVRVQRTSINKYVRLEEVLKIGYKIPGKDNLALWRNQAMACLLFLSCARAGAAVSLPIQTVHLNNPHPNIEQKTELGMQTKLSKSATTFLHQIPRLLDFARGWDEFTRANFPKQHLWYAPIQQRWGGDRAQKLSKRVNIVSTRRESDSSCSAKSLIFHIDLPTNIVTGMQYTIWSVAKRWQSITPCLNCRDPATP